MGVVLKRLNAKLRVLFSIDFIPKDFRRFSVVHTGFIISTLFSGTFIQIFLTRLADNIHVVMTFTMITYSTSGVMMLLAAVFLRYRSPDFIMKIGFGFYLLLFTLLIILKEDSVKVMPLMGLLQGSGSAFYWINYFYLYTEYTTNNNRDVSGSFIALLTSLSQITVPLLSGFIISRFVGFGGYIVVFSLAFLAMLFAATFSATLATVEPAFAKFSRPKHIKAAKLILKDKRYLRGFLAEGSKGVRDGVFQFFLNIILFKLVRDELLVGFNTFLSAFVGLVGIWLMSRILKPEIRIKAMSVAVVVLLFFGLVFVFKMHAVTVILLNVVNAGAYPYFSYSETNIFLYLLQKMPYTAECQPEMFGFRELFLGLGRCTGIGLLVLLPRDNWQLYGIAMVGLTVFQIVTVLLCKSCVKDIEELSGGEGS